MENRLFVITGVKRRDVLVGLSERGAKVIPEQDTPALYDRLRQHIVLESDALLSDYNGPTFLGQNAFLIFLQILLQSPNNRYTQFHAQKRIESHIKNLGGGYRGVFDVSSEETENKEPGVVYVPPDFSLPEILSIIETRVSHVLHSGV